MLTHLSIRNIVLIDACDIPFEDGLCVMTGETGAGKSILLDALGLAVGMRADAGLLREGADQASVTAEFDIAGNSHTRSVLTELGLPTDDGLVVRRVLQSDGKSRCFVNDEPVSVGALKRIGETLLEVHGQHDQRGLMDVGTHLDMLDAYGRLEADLRDVEVAFNRWQALKGELDHITHRIAETQREQDYLRHICHELGELSPESGEEAALTMQRTTMMQGEKLAETITDAMRELEGDGAVEAALRTAQRLLSRSTLAMADRFEPIIGALERAQIEVQESLSALDRLLRDSTYDALALEKTEERLFALKAAARKYNLPADELGGLLKEVEDKLATLDNQQHHIGGLQERVLDAKQQYLVLAQALSDARAKTAERLQKTLMKELAPLKMAKCRFRVVQEELAEQEWNVRGTDRVRFEAATNTGQNYAPLHKIASGGELSRFMLAMKVVLSSLKSIPTLIFDEIDTGTGGAVADAIGARLALLSDRAQVLVVTHLPQVAARGNHHLVIEKTDRRGMTRTDVRVLDIDERKEELARMLAGATVTDEARGAAQRLMEAAG